MIHSTTEAVIGAIPEGNAAGAEAAVAAARTAFDNWAATPVAKHAEYIQKIADGLYARSEELAQLIAGEVSMPIKSARAVWVGGSVYSWSNFAKLLGMFEFEEHVGNSLVVREPASVVGTITPQNYPLNQTTLKVAPALAVGRTVVLKPLGVALLNAFVLAEVIEEAGLSSGVLNLITDYGPVVGKVLASNPEVDMVSFTGSARVGRRVAELASQSVGRVVLKLGDKSASVILDDADLASTVKGALSVYFLDSGQTCSAHMRILVPRARYEEVKAPAAWFVAAYVPGDPAQENARLGPLISVVQRDRVLGYIHKELEKGAGLITGDADMPEGLTTGCFAKSTMLDSVKTADTVAREEIFGLVLTIVYYSGEEETVRIASGSTYDPGGGMWSGDEVRAIRVARRIHTGQVNINGGPFNMQAPFDDYRQSGSGRENGKYDLEEFLKYKVLQLNPAEMA